MKDFKDFDKVMQILTTAKGMLADARHNSAPIQLPQYKASLAFLEPSTRTHFSFQQAAYNLGMRVTDIEGEDNTSRSKGESIADTFRSFTGQGARVLVLRTKIEGAPRHIAKKLQTYVDETSIINPGPLTVINGGDGRNQHPTQTFLDLLTIWQTLGRLNNFTIGITNDLLHGRTGHSLAEFLSICEGVKVVLVSPKGLEMPERYKKGLDIVSESDDIGDLADCDIVYVTRFQDERIDNPELKRQIEIDRQRFIINKRILDSWNPNTRIMHPLPKIWEIHPELSEDKRVIAYVQAEYGILARMTLLSMSCDANLYVPLPLEYPAVELINKTEEKEANAKTPKHFHPVEKGTTIDHIPEGKVETVIDILRTFNAIQKGQTWLSVNCVDSNKYGRKKDILLLHNIELPTKVCAIIQGIFPQITFNFLPGDKTLIKRSFNAPSHVDGIRCPNKDCITNIDLEAKPNFVFNGDNKVSRELICEYCEKPLWC